MLAKAQLPAGGIYVSTHSRPKAAGAYAEATDNFDPVSTHSRPKAAGASRLYQRAMGYVSTHSRPKAAGHSANIMQFNDWFQHTAARRRLVSANPKLVATRSFNTQPPEGGWAIQQHLPEVSGCFNTQPPEGGWT